MQPTQPIQQYRSEHISGHWLCRSPDTQGGDVLAIIPDQHRTLFIIADVCGNGFKAYPQRLFFEKLLQQGLETCTDLVSLCNQLNASLLSAYRGKSYVSAFFLSFDHDTECLHYVNAGHPPQYVVSGNELMAFDTPGYLLGMFEQVLFQEHVFSLRRPATLVMYTDGFEDSLCDHNDTELKTYLSNRIALLQGQDDETALQALATGAPIFDPALAIKEDAVVGLITLRK